LIGAEILSITALVGVVTIAVSSYMILYNHQLYRFCERLGVLDWRFFRTPQRCRGGGRRGPRHDACEARHRGGHEHAGP
jgi:hypothetical protein